MWNDVQGIFLIQRKRRKASTQREGNYRHMSLWGPGSAWMSDRGIENNGVLHRELRGSPGLSMRLASPLRISQSSDP